MKLKECSKISVVHDKDRHQCETYITGICVLCNGSLLVVDNQNKSLKIVKHHNNALSDVKTNRTSHVYQTIRPLSLLQKKRRFNSCQHVWKCRLSGGSKSVVSVVVSATVMVNCWLHTTAQVQTGDKKFGWSSV